MADESPSRRRKRRNGEVTRVEGGEAVEPQQNAEVSTPSSSSAVRAATLITNLIKLGGLAIAGNEALLQESPHDPVVFAVAAFMMAGAQGLDSFLTNFLGDKQKP